MLNNSSIRVPIAISLGAIAGSLCRYFIGQWITLSVDSHFPWGTLAINLSGCFLMGLITTLAGRRWSLQPDLLLLVTTGFLGSYTTFSSYELEAAVLFTSLPLQGELFYWVGSPVLGFLCLRAGVEVAKLAIADFPEN